MDNFSSLKLRTSCKPAFWWLLPKAYSQWAGKPEKLMLLAGWAVMCMPSSAPNLSELHEEKLGPMLRHVCAWVPPPSPPLSPPGLAYVLALNTSMLRYKFSGEAATGNHHINKSVEMPTLSVQWLWQCSELHPLKYWESHVSSCICTATRQTPAELCAAQHSAWVERDPQGL